MDGSNSFWLQSAILPVCFISEDSSFMKYHGVFLSEVFEINGWMRVKPFVTLIMCDLFVTIKPLSRFLCNIFLWHTNSIFFLFIFLSPLICDCLLCVPFAEELEEEKESPTETELTEKQKHQLRHRELFLSRQYESLPATHIRCRTKTHTHTHTHEHHQGTAVPMDGHLSSHEKTNAYFLSFTWCLFLLSLPIRGKCSVALLNETEAVLSYLDKEVSQRGKQLGYVIFYRCLPAADCVLAGQVRLFQAVLADDKNWGKGLRLLSLLISQLFFFFSFILWSA